MFVRKFKLKAVYIIPTCMHTYTHIQCIVARLPKRIFRLYICIFRYIDKSITMLKTFFFLSCMFIFYPNERGITDVFSWHVILYVFNMFITCPTHDKTTLSHNKIFHFCFFRCGWLVVSCFRVKEKFGSITLNLLKRFFCFSIFTFFALYWISLRARSRLFAYFVLF